MNVVLAGCTKSKRDGTHLARDLYDESSIFRRRRDYADLEGDAWGVLSARYGYLRPTDVVPTYDTHISDRTAVWAAFVLEDLLADLAYLEADVVTILAGAGYVDPLVAPLEARGFDVVDWNRGKRPGEREKALKEALAPGQQATFDDVAADGGRP